MTISCETPDANIYYTLDGTTPSTNSLTFVAPFVVSTDSTLSAKAFKEGYAASDAAQFDLPFIRSVTLSNGQLQVIARLPVSICCELETSADLRVWRSQQSGYCGTGDAVAFTYSGCGSNFCGNQFFRIKKRNEVVPSLP